MTFVESPIFLVGSERSGTTLLRLMLDHHPRIAFHHEAEYIVTQIADDGTFPEKGRYREWLRNDRVFQHSPFTIDERLDFVALVNDFLIQKKTRDNKELVGATIHYQFRKLGKIWPRAKYIYLYRDGRDVAKSAMRMGWAGNTYSASDRWLEAETEWDKVRASLDRVDWTEIRYEDLIASTEPNLERICDFLGVAYSEKMLDYVKDSTYSAPDARLKQQWKTRMPKLEVQRLEDKLGDRLLLRGYELSGHPRIRVTNLTRKYLYLQSRLKVFLFRLTQYGVALTLQETLSRRFGLTRIHLGTVKRINQIINASLK
jgi:hypothetical protein